MSIARVLTCSIPASLAASLALTASAGEIRDGGDAGPFFADSTSNMAIYDSFFEVQFYNYDGNGETPEDEFSVGEITYNSFLSGTGVPAGEVFTSLEMQLTPWDGRDEFDEQTLDQIYIAELSENGVDYTPLPLTFDGAFPANDGDGFADVVATASGFESQYLRITINARTESAGSGSNDSWSSRIQEIYMITALPGTIGGGLAGDFDGLGSVEQADLDLVLTNWGGTRAFEDGVTTFATPNVDQEELDIVLTNWGSSAAPSFEGFAVPEPVSVTALAGLGLAGLRRRVA